jgi:hypothetical protein
VFSLDQRLESNESIGKKMKYRRCLILGLPPIFLPGSHSFVALSLGRPSRSRQSKTCVVPLQAQELPLSPDNIHATAKPSKARVNSTVRQHMELLLERLGHGAIENEDGSAPETAAWKRTRAYLYRTNLSTRQLEKVLDVLEERLAIPLVRHVIQTSPRILRKHPRTHLAPTLNLLEELFGESLLLEALRRNPDLLLTSGAGYNGDDLELVEFLFQQDLGMKKSELLKLKRSAPFVFQLPLSKILATIAYLSNLLEKGGYQEDEKARKRILVKTILSHPPLLQLSVEANLQPRIEYLRERCDLQATDVCALIKSCSAGILGLSVGDNLATKLDALQALLPESGHLRQCLLRHPQILGLSADNLQGKSEYFRKIDNSLAARILLRSPAVFSLSLENNVNPKIDFLAGVWGISSVQPRAPTEKTPSKNPLASLLYEYPSILTLSLEGNLRPTVEFFNKTGYIDLDEDWRVQDGSALLRGRYLAASLYNRLLPRFYFAQSCSNPSLTEQEDPTESVDKEASLLVPLHLLVSGSDTAFCEALGASTEQYNVFKVETLPRLKFSSQFATWLKTGRPIDV